MPVYFEDLHWESDWNGYEVGYPDLSVVGLYSTEDGNYTLNMYIDMETCKVLEFWSYDIAETY